eukprot:4784170-Pleurochrysis_carterae.AAC.7
MMPWNSGGRAGARTERCCDAVSKCGDQMTSQIRGPSILPRWQDDLIYVLLMAMCLYPSLEERSERAVRVVGSSKPAHFGLFSIYPRLKPGIAKATILRKLQRGTPRQCILGTGRACEDGALLGLGDSTETEARLLKRFRLSARIIMAVVAW